MAKRHNQKGRRTGDGQYMPIPYATARHEAFRGLSGAALKVFIELRSRYLVRGDGSNNNGEITLALEEAARLLSLGKATVQRALKELDTAGFIIRTKRGQWYGRKASCYAVTDCPLDGQPPMRSWQKPKAEKQNSVPKPTMFDHNGVILKPQHIQ